MNFQRLFTERPGTAAAKALFAGAIAQARDPHLYLEGGAPDTTEGRFELYALHVVLLVRRLSGADPEVVELRQGVFDAFVRNLDDGLREMGVGDLSVGKKMRRLAEAFYGRLKALDQAFEGTAPQGALEAFVGRTLFGGRDGAAARAAPIAAYLRRAAAALDAEPIDGFRRGEAAWPSFLL